MNLDETQAWAPGERQKHEAVIEWLQSKGESVEKAREDIARWRSWSTVNGEFQRNLAAEVAERKAREAAGKQQPADGGVNANGEGR